MPKNYAQESNMLVRHVTSDMARNLMPINTIRGLSKDDPSYVDDIIKMFGEVLKQAIAELPPRP